MKLYIFYRFLKEIWMKWRIKELVEVVILDGSYEVFGVEVDIISM